MEIGLTPDEFFYSTVTDNYQNLSPETSTIFKVLQTGQPILYYEQQLTTLNGFSYLSLSSTYPIMEHGKSIGGIEFSKHFYESKQIKYLDNFLGHKLYRDNHTTLSPRGFYYDKRRHGDIIAQGIHNETSALQNHLLH
ncbi:hypothetical protein [Lysinibacillus sp. UBA5990]|uniref:hypothetical protein n=1 Tax=Lysinibacillus sp. UBA5990 TaxID=1946773 RepID=UPI0025C3E2DD|nr:hypothetical protein [Lysinibacillus sp. UBA5990]